jgi:glycolate oxidase
VSFIQVMGEAMKLGLACNVLGAGCQVSMLASYTSMHGNNVLAVSQGYSGRNLLGVEWVLPTGEVVKLGAAGSGDGWFSGDGPGPSLRGILRGALGAQSGLGVFTRIGAHLHPWYGPAELDIKGNSPYYEAVIPPNFEYHICEFPTWQAYADAMRLVGGAGLAFGLQKTGGPGSVGNCVTGNNNEYYARKTKGELQIPWKSFCIVMQGATSEEHDWQVKTLNKILEETGGKIAEVGEDPAFKNSDFLTMVKSCFIPRLAFRPSGTFGVDGMIGMETADAMGVGLVDDEAQFQKWRKTGIIVDDGNINNWSVTYEGSHWALFECGYQFSSIDMDSIKGYQKMTAEGFDICYKKPYAISWAVMGPDDMKRIGPVCMNYPTWMGKVKKTFDPKTTADPTLYPTLDMIKTTK